MWVSGKEFRRKPVQTATAWLRGYFGALAVLDERSLAVFRVLVALVVLFDIWLAWSMLDLWPGLQGFVSGLPLPLLLGSESWTLGVLLGVYAVLAAGLFLGYQTRWCTLGVWLMSSGYQYTARYTADYHNEILCTLLFWCQFLDLGRRWSLDARRARSRNTPKRHLLEQIAACFFVLTFAHIYLDNVANKFGDAWRQDGTAIWFALKDMGLSSQIGLWAVEHLPFEIFWAANYGVLAIELLAPILILSPRWRAQTRIVGCCMLFLLHGGLWVFMDLEAFPLTMIAGAFCLLPAAFWSRFTAARPVSGAGVERVPVAAARKPTLRPTFLLWMLLCVGLVINLEGSRLLSLEEYPYPGSRWIERTKYFLGLETEWWMYASEPPDFGGWWVVVARTADGREIDPITLKPPTLQKPDPKAEVYLKKGASYWFEAPDEADSPSRRYADFLAWNDRRSNPPAQRITHMVFLYMYESYLPLQNQAHPAVPVLLYTWPKKNEQPRPPLLPHSLLRRVQLFELDADALWYGAWVPDQPAAIFSY